MLTGIILARLPSGFDGRKWRVRRSEARRAASKLAGGVSHRKTAQTESAPAGAAESRSPQIPLVAFHAAESQEFEILILISLFSVMLLLPFDVATNTYALRWTHREAAVALLP